MDRVEELESAVSGLPPEEYRRFAEWFRALDEQRWGQEMDHDLSTGKLAFLFHEAERERVAGPLIERPPRK